MLATVRHVDWDIIKCLVIAGPGFAKDKFHEYLDAEAVKRDLKCVSTPPQSVPRRGTCQRSLLLNACSSRSALNIPHSTWLVAVESPPG